MKRARAGIAGIALLAYACGPEPVAPEQLLVVVETDAPLPAAGLAPDAITLFDRLRIAVYTGDSPEPCGGCVREFVVDEDSPAPLSVGVVVTDARAVAKVQLYAVRNVDRDGLPDEGSSLSAWIRLPVPGAAEVRSLFAVLRVAELGVSRGTRTAPVDASDHASEPPLVRWPEARRVPCTADVAADETCVPGGVVWMGNAARAAGPAAGLLPRLVKMSPFVLDRHEVTVRSFRESGLAKPASAPGGPEPDISPADFCTFAPVAGANDDHPINCLRWSTARQLCQKHGRDLPTEAQLEYVEGGLRGARYPWGDVDPRCDELAFGQSKDESGGCGPLRGTTVVESLARDVLRLPGGGVLSDLAGNVSEWARDSWHPAEDACNMQGFVQDPRCLDTRAAEHPTRGGNYGLVALAARSYVRLDGVDRDNFVGFRCARDLPPP